MGTVNNARQATPQVDWTTTLPVHLFLARHFRPAPAQLARAGAVEPAAARWQTWRRRHCCRSPVVLLARRTETQPSDTGSRRIFLPPHARHCGTAARTGTPPASGCVARARRLGKAPIIHLITTLACACLHHLLISMSTSLVLR